METPAHNWRFGVMAAVTPQKRQCENERFSPARTFVKPPPAPSRRSLTASGGQRSAKLTEEPYEKRENIGKMKNNKYE